MKFEKDDEKMKEERKKEDLEGDEDFAKTFPYEHWIKTDYFRRLEKLGDYKIATQLRGYDTPFLDFGISKIFDSHYYVIGNLVEKPELGP